MYQTVPYFRSRGAFVQDHTLDRRRGAAVVDHSLDRNRSSTRFNSRNNKPLTLDAFAVTGLNWLGASSIVYRLRVTCSKTLSFITLPPKPAGVDFCLCVSWVNEDSTVERYKLWSDVGEILYVSIYDGRRLPNTFYLEFWSTEDSTTAQLTSAIDLFTSLLGLPVGKDDFSGGNYTASLLVEVVDIGPWFEITPVSYEDYLVASDGKAYQLQTTDDGLLVVDQTPVYAGDFPEYLSIRADDGLIYRFYLEKAEQAVIPKISQEAVADAEFMDEYELTASDSSIYRLRLYNISGNIIYALV